MQSLKNVMATRAVFYTEPKTPKVQRTSEVRATPVNDSIVPGAHRGPGRPRRRAAESEEEDVQITQTAERSDLRSWVKKNDRPIAKPREGRAIKKIIITKDGQSDSDTSL